VVDHIGAERGGAEPGQREGRRSEGLEIFISNFWKISHESHPFVEIVKRPERGVVRGRPPINPPEQAKSMTVVDKRIGRLGTQIPPVLGGFVEVLWFCNVLSPGLACKIGVLRRFARACHGFARQRCGLPV